MSPAEVRLSVIRAQIERDWNEVLRQSERAASVDAHRGGPEAAFVALALDHAYQAFEQLLLTVERALVLPERAGEHWHRAVLADATRTLPGIRPPIVPVAVEREWEHLLGFRHFLRHAYAAELDPVRLDRNIQRLRAACVATEPLVRALIEAIGSVAG